MNFSDVATTSQSRVHAFQQKTMHAADVDVDVDVALPFVTGGNLDGCLASVHTYTQEQ